MTSVMWFESYWEGMKPEVGGKASSLGEMTGAGLPGAGPGNFPEK